MSRESSRRYGAVNFEKAQYEELEDGDSALVKSLFYSLLANALKEAKLDYRDNFSLRLVVTENFPEDMP